MDLEMQLGENKGQFKRLRKREVRYMMGKGRRGRRSEIRKTKEGKKEG